MRTTVESGSPDDPTLVRLTVTNDAGDSVTVDYPPEEADEIGRQLITAARLRTRRDEGISQRI
jgi:hypothetical protein